jgi:hypothetical protein
MRKWFVSLSLACGCSIALANAASAQVAIQVQAQAAQVQKIQVQAQPIQAQPIQIQLQVQPGQGPLMPAIGIPGNRLAPSDAVFVGRVMAIEPMDVDAAMAPNAAKVKFRVVIVQITESIFGLKKDTKSVRIGFLPSANNFLPIGGGLQIQPINGLRRPFPGNFQQQVNLQVGQDGLFTVNKIHNEDFYLMPSFQNFVTRENNPNFDTQVKTAKQLSKVMADQKLVVDPNAKLQPANGIDPKPGFEPGIRPRLPIRIQPGQIQNLPALQDLPAQPAPKQDK